MGFLFVYIHFVFYFPALLQYMLLVILTLEIYWNQTQACNAVSVLLGRSYPGFW